MYKFTQSSFKSTCSDIKQLLNRNGSAPFLVHFLFSVEYN